MKTRHAIMGIALVAAAALVAFGDNRPDGEIAEPVARTVPAMPPGPVTVAGRTLAERAQAPALLPPQAGAGAPAPGTKAPPHILRLLPRQALVGQGSTGGEVFGSRDWTPPPPPPPPPAALPPPPPPSAPPLPFTLLGKALENGAWEVYLARAGKTYVVKPKTVIDGTYRVDAIAPPILTLTYLPLNQVQQLNIGAFD